MLIRASDLQRMFDGSVDLAFRRWKRPTVRTGGSLRTRLGVLQIVEVLRIEEQDIGDADARRAGCEDRAALLALLAGRQGELYRVTLEPGGVDPRQTLREDADLDAAAVAAIDARLRRLDTASRRGPWTARILELIAEQPATRAPELAERLGQDKPWFKAQVRKLKELGLTESLEVGYRLSPRGVAHRQASRG